MAVTRDDVLHVARLARLRLSAEEVERFTAQLNGILEHVEELNTVDVAGVAAVGGATEWNAPRRTEEEGPDLLERPVAELAPAWREGLITVPRLAALDTSELDEAFEDKASLEPAVRPGPQGRAGGAT